MIHSAKPTVSTPVANIVFCSFVFLDLNGRTYERTYERTTCAKNNDPYRPYCGLAEWINHHCRSLNTFFALSLHANFLIV